MKIAPLYSLFLLFLFSSTASVGQNLPISKTKKAIDIIELKALYRMKHLRDTVRKTLFEDVFALEIGNKHIKFHSIYKDRGDSAAAYPHLYGLKAEKKGHSDGIKPLDFGKNQIPPLESYIFNYPQKGQLSVFRPIFDKIYVYSEDIPKMQWQVENEIQEILGFSCQKAKTHFRGREYIVWFSPEIPYAYGPWKFGGLPGLIVKAETINTSDGGYFCFQLESIEKPKPSQYIYEYQTARIQSSRQVIRSYIIRLREDPIGEFKISGGVDMHIPNPSGGAYKAGTYSLPYRPELELE